VRDDEAISKSNPKLKALNSDQYQKSKIKNQNYKLKCKSALPAVIASGANAERGNPSFLMKF
jgi:hypothetical protein